MESSGEDGSRVYEDISASIHRTHITSKSRWTDSFSLVRRVAVISTTWLLLQPKGYEPIIINSGTGFERQQNV